MALSRGSGFEKRGILILCMLICAVSVFAEEYKPAIIVTPQFENIQKGNVAEMNIVVVHQQEPIQDAVMRTLIVDAENNIVYANIQKVDIISSDIDTSYFIPMDAVTGNYVVSVDISKDDLILNKETASFRVLDEPVHKDAKALELLLILAMAVAVGILGYKRYRHLKNEYYY